MEAAHFAQDDKTSQDDKREGVGRDRPLVMCLLEFSLKIKDF